MRKEKYHGNPSLNRLAKAVRKLYKAAYWSSEGQLSDEHEMLLWEDVRKAAGIKKGTATKLNVGACLD